MLVLSVCWLGWRSVVHRLGVRGEPSVAGAGAALLLVLGLVTVVVWVLNPYTALLLVPALHLWLIVADPEGVVTFTERYSARRSEGEYMRSLRGEVGIAGSHGGSTAKTAIRRQAGDWAARVIARGG